MRVTARLRMLGSALADRCQTPVVEEVYNKSLIDWVSGQYGEILHECAEVFSRAEGEGKYCTRPLHCYDICCYKTVWSPSTGEILEAAREPDHPHDHHSVVLKS